MANCSSNSIGLKKNLNKSTEWKRSVVEPDNPRISVKRQCELLDLSRSAYYYRPRQESDANLERMRRIDEQFTKHPDLGSRRLATWLTLDCRLPTARRRARRLMRTMGITAIYPKKCLSLGNKEHKKYPYLLTGLTIAEPDHVWCSDITYIRLRGGFVYLTAIMDWASRYVLDWELSCSLEADFCVETLERSLSRGQPRIFNTDQGSQYTSEPFTSRLEDAGVAISMDGRGRCFDNIMIERLWRTVKYEEVYLREYESVVVCRKSLGKFFDYYNCERRHGSLDDRTPWSVYHEGV